MTDQEALTIFYGALAAAGLVVVIAASLLLAIRVTAGAIDNLAQTALTTARKIVVNTEPIWDLHAVDGVARRILAGGAAIEGRARAIAEAAARERRR